MEKNSCGKKKGGTLKQIAEQLTSVSGYTDGDGNIYVITEHCMVESII